MILSMSMFTALGVMFGTIGIIFLWTLLLDMIKYKGDGK